MKAQYQAWIAEHVPEDSVGECARFSREMSEAFPELKRVRGWINGAEHWWCKTEAGEIVDPTERQFLAFYGWIPPYSYREFREGIDREPLGKCMNCGGYVWESTWTSAACSAHCARELEEYYG